MKKLFFVAAAFVAGFAASAQQKVDDVIKINIEKYDFGKIKQNNPVTTYFTIKNISDKPISIENAMAGCGCTTPEVSKAPIAPGATTQLKVGYNAANPAPFTKDVSIKVAGIQDMKVVKITGEVLDATAYDAYVKSDEYKKAEQAKAAADKTQATDAKKNKKVKATK
ncbi:MAG TPA: DUF1573 domain-containing protein [Flavisolibacter sp.]|jgi:hypothetical protein|nr:DUF1573 domain-containing protein [Flavisolibacter sp.]